MITKEFTKSDWDKLLLDQILKCNDIESAILKGHILLEYLLNHFIEKANPNVKIEMRTFTFSTKAKIFEIFCPNDLSAEIQTLNKLRNQIAHTLEIKELDFVGFANRKKEDFETGVDFMTPTDFSARIIFLLGKIHRLIQESFERK